MPRASKTLFASMSFHPKTPGIIWAVAQAKERGETLGTYLKPFVLALLNEKPFVLLRWKECSRVLKHLEQEAESLEMSIDEYIKALLADRDQGLYEKERKPANLWFPRGYQQSTDLLLVNDQEETKGDDLNLENALNSVDSFLAGMDI